MGEYQGLDQELGGVVGEEGSDSSYVAQEESASACQSGDVLGIREAGVDLALLLGRMSAFTVIQLAKTGSVQLGLFYLQYCMVLDTAP